MQFNVINWNVGGAKFLEEPKEDERIRFKETLNIEIAKLAQHHKPHVITLQEIVQYQTPGQKIKQDLIDPPEGYYYHPCILINTIDYAYVSKWRKIEKNWPRGTYFGQGNAILCRKGLSHTHVWSLRKIGFKRDYKPRRIEKVVLMSGLYFGDRDTEPRAAMVSHFVISHDPSGKRRLKKPLDVFVVNLHLTTLMGEREGMPGIDAKASKIRIAQLDILLDGIVSRYNDWRQKGYPFRHKRRKPGKHETFKRYSPTWILCGDFNFTPESVEYATLTRMNFVNANPIATRSGTKGKGRGAKAKATITCDYIFIGPKYISLDPIFTEVITRGNPSAFDHIKVSDHYPLFAEIPLSIL